MLPARPARLAAISAVPACWLILPVVLVCIHRVPLPRSTMPLVCGVPPLRKLILPPARIARLPLRNRIGAEMSTAPAGPVAISSRPRLAPPRLLVISGASTDSRSLALRVTRPPASAPVTTEALTVALPLAPLAPPTEPEVPPEATMRRVVGSSSQVPPLP